MTYNSIIYSVTGWFFGLLFAAIGIINMGWGNDPEFGVFILLLSLLYIPPVNTYLQQLTGIIIPVWIKILTGIFILWASLGVGELFDKIDMIYSAAPAKFEMIEPSPLGFFHVTRYM